jgi:4-aminobutyrate aminotransferase-like enzyme
MGGVVTRPDILDRLCQYQGYFNTFGGSPVAAAAGLAVLDVIEAEGLMSRAFEVGTYLRHCLSQLALAFPLIGDVRGAGQFSAMELVVDPLTKEPNSALASTVINGLRKRHILIGAAGPYGNTLKIRPPLCFTKSDADFFIATLTDVLSSNEIKC